MRIYLAHPMNGLDYTTIMDYYDNTKKLLEKYYTILSPMTGKEYLRNELEFRAFGYDNPVSTNHAIIERDRWMVQNSDIVFADLTDSISVSIGSMMELAWAHHLGKHTIVVLQKGNIHEHAFVLESADIRFENYNDAIKYLINLGSSVKG